MKNLSVILEELANLLESVGEENWCLALKRLKFEYDSAENELDRKPIKRDILRIYGGMGSFSDLVLYENLKVLIEANQELEKLKKQLFEVAQN